MKKSIVIILILTMFVLLFSGCAKEPVDALELEVSGYTSGCAVLKFRNNSGKTITRVEGKVILWSTKNDKLGEKYFTWNDTCAPGERLEVRVQVGSSGSVSRVGYSLYSINDGQIDIYM